MNPQAGATPDAPLVWLCIDYRQGFVCGRPKSGVHLPDRVMSHREERGTFWGPENAPL